VAAIRSANRQRAQPEHAFCGVQPDTAQLGAASPTPAAYCPDKLCQMDWVHSC
jgi:hypothetical protein